MLYNNFDSTWVLIGQQVCSATRLWNETKSSLRKRSHRNVLLKKNGAMDRENNALGSLQLLHTLH